MDRLLYGYDLILSARSFKVARRNSRGQRAGAPRPCRARRCAGQRSQPIFASVPVPNPRSTGIAQAGPEPVRNAGRTPPPISVWQRRAPLHRPQRHESRGHVALAARPVETRPSRLGHRTIAGAATAGRRQRPPIMSSGPCFCRAPPPTRPLERLVWPKPARLPATAAGDFFPPPAMPALHREAKKTARRRQPLRSALRVRAGRPPSDRQPSRPR